MTILELLTVPVSDDSSGSLILCAYYRVTDVKREIDVSKLLKLNNILVNMRNDIN